MEFRTRFQLNNDYNPKKMPDFFKIMDLFNLFFFCRILNLVNIIKLQRKSVLNPNFILTVQTPLIIKLSFTDINYVSLSMSLESYHLFTE